MRLTPRQAEILLDTLCQRLGFCLSATQRAALRDYPPPDPKSFTDAVFRAEGLDPLTADSDTYGEVEVMVAQAFAAANERPA